MSICLKLKQCIEKGISVPISMRFNSGSVCLVASNCLFPFIPLDSCSPYPTRCKSFTETAKCPKSRLDLVGLFPKLDLKLRGIQQCLVWLIFVQDTRSLPALNVSCKDKEWFCVMHNALVLLHSIYTILCPLCFHSLVLDGSWESTKWSFVADLGDGIMKSSVSYMIWWFDLLIHLLLHFSELFLKKAEISSNSACKLFLNCLYPEIWNNCDYKMQWNMMKGSCSLPLLA